MATLFQSRCRYYSRRIFRGKDFVLGKFECRDLARIVGFFRCGGEIFEKEFSIGKYGSFGFEKGLRCRVRGLCRNNGRLRCCYFCIFSGFFRGNNWILSLKERTRSCFFILFRIVIVLCRNKNILWRGFNNLNLQLVRILLGILPHFAYFL